MMRRTPMRRTPFKSKVRPHEPAVEREPRPLAKASRPASYSGSVTGNPVSKEAPARSEAYRRLVAALPCCGCGKPGPNQAAHANQGKGMGMKADDRLCFPLCPPCHRAFDQGAMYDKEERRRKELLWAARSRAVIGFAGDWPKNLPGWIE